MAWSGTGTPVHEGSNICRRMAAQQMQHEVAAEGVWAAGRRFMTYDGNKLHNVTWCKYLERLLSHDNNGISAMNQHLKRIWATWRQVSEIFVARIYSCPLLVCSIKR